MFEQMCKTGNTGAFIFWAYVVPDINGDDAASKIKILSSLAFNSFINDLKYTALIQICKTWIEKSAIKCDVHEPLLLLQ